MLRSFGRRRSVWLFCFAACVGIGFWLVNQLRAQEPAAAVETAPDALSTFMRLKLEHSKSILEGLAVEDYELISKSAQSLSLLSLESNWNRLQTEEYLTSSREFRRAAQGIRDAATGRNLEGAALRYVSMTVQCVECHQYLRRLERERR